MSTPPPLVVVDYGMGNIHSILKALKLYYPNVIYSNNKKDLDDSIAIVLPGDGAFGSAMKNINEKYFELRKNLDNNVNAKKAILGICIGFQILFENSDETFFENNYYNNHSDNLINGLGYIKGNIRRFKANREFNVLPADNHNSKIFDNQNFASSHLPADNRNAKIADSANFADNHNFAFSNLPADNHYAKIADSANFADNHNFAFSNLPADNHNAKIADDHNAKIADNHNLAFSHLPTDNHNAKIADNQNFIPKKYRIPHISWNLINYTNSTKKEFMYFIHSYRAENVPENYVLAYCNYANENFPAYVKKENIVGTQFHPEKSGVLGLKLLENWIKEFVL